MAQATNPSISSGQTGTQYRTQDNDRYAATLTMHSGSSRPTYSVAQTLWCDTSGTPWILKMYDGADDISIGTVNASTNAFAPSGAVTSVATAGMASGGTITGIGTITVDISALTADGSPDRTADYVATYDASASAHKKVLLSSILGTVASKNTGTSGDAVPLLNANGAWSAPQSGVRYALTDAATISWDMASGNNAYVVLGGNRTLGVPTNGVAGMSGELDVVQDDTGSRTLAYSWCYRHPSGTATTLTTTALARDKLSYSVWRLQSATVTITIATPGVVTYAGHGLLTGDIIQLTTTGALPTGLSASTTYWVIKIDADSFWLATSQANAAANTKIATSGSQSGTHTCACIMVDIAATKDTR